MSVADPSLALRAPTPEELARIEQARRSLASAARWLRLGISLPVLLGVVACAYAAIANHGTAYEKVLAGLLVFLATGFFTALPLFLSSSGRTLIWHARLARDRARGFNIARERGEVHWGRSSYVATVAGKSLISPSFTRHGVLPSRWNDFELLPPGSYVFELLPESGLVVRAEPIARDERSAGHAALLAAFKMGESELVANREGRATDGQRWRLAVSSSRYVLLSTFLSVLCYLALRDTWRAPQLGSSFILLVVALITAFMAVLVGRRFWDILEGQVRSETGPVRFSYSKSFATGSIGNVEFTCSRTQARALPSKREYRVYYFRRSHALIGAEPG